MTSIQTRPAKSLKKGNDKENIAAEAEANGQRPDLVSDIAKAREAKREQPGGAAQFVRRPQVNGRVHDDYLDLKKTNTHPIPKEPVPLPATLVKSILCASDLLIMTLFAGLLLGNAPGLGLSFGAEAALAVAFGVMALLIYNAFGIYEDIWIFSRRAHVGRLLGGWGAITVSALLAGKALDITGIAFSQRSAALLLTVLGVQLAGRFVWHIGVRSLVKRKRLARRTMIIGASEHGQRVAAYLNAADDVRTRIIGFVDDRLDGRVPDEAHGIGMIGDIETLLSMIHDNLVDQVIIALPWSAEDRVQQLAKRLSNSVVDVRLAPDLMGLWLADRRTTQIAGLNMPNVVDRPISGRSQLLKMIEDRVGSLLLIVLFAPVMLALALLVKLDSPGPIIFRQRRYGFNNSLITVYKFRTMYTECADPDCEVQAAANDPRVTRIGRFLRRYSLDELPQLFNVVTNEMSLVGPRPHAILSKADGRMFDEVVENYASRHRVKPGITGWAQVNGWRGETDTCEKLEKRVEHDLYYIENWSLWFDLYILFVTPFAMRAP